MKGLLQPQTTSSSRKTDGTFALGSAPSNKSASYSPDLVGQQFGWVKIISPHVMWLGGKDKHGHLSRFRHFQTECTGCGTQKWINADNLLRGKTKGCQACSQPRQIPKWLDRRLTQAKYRCECPAAKNYVNYGGRGIRFDFPSVTEAGVWIIQNLGLQKDKEID